MEVFSRSVVLVFSLVLLSLVKGQNVVLDCNGKQTICVGPLHYLPCVDNGQGKMETGEGFAQICPIGTECSTVGPESCVPITNEQIVEQITDTTILTVDASTEPNTIITNTIQPNEETIQNIDRVTAKSPVFEALEVFPEVSVAVPENLEIPSEAPIEIATVITAPEAPVVAISEPEIVAPAKVTSDVPASEILVEAAPEAVEVSPGAAADIVAEVPVKLSPLSESLNIAPVAVTSEKAAPADVVFVAPVEVAPEVPASEALAPEDSLAVNAEVLLSEPLAIKPVVEIISEVPVEAVTDALDISMNGDAPLSEALAIESVAPVEIVSEVPVEAVSETLDLVPATVTSEVVTPVEVPVAVLVEIDPEAPVLAPEVQAGVVSEAALSEILATEVPFAATASEIPEELIPVEIPIEITHEVVAAEVLASEVPVAQIPVEAPLSVAIGVEPVAPVEIISEAPVEITAETSISNIAAAPTALEVLAAVEAPSETSVAEAAVPASEVIAEVFPAAEGSESLAAVSEVAQVEASEIPVPISEVIQTEAVIAVPDVTEAASEISAQATVEIAPEALVGVATDIVVDGSVPEVTVEIVGTSIPVESTVQDASAAIAITEASSPTITAQVAEITAPVAEVAVPETATLQEASPAFVDATVPQIAISEPIASDFTAASALEPIGLETSGAPSEISVAETIGEPTVVENIIDSTQIVGSEQTVGTSKTLVDPRVEIITDVPSSPAASVVISEPAAVDMSTILVPSIVVPGPETEIASEVITGGVIAPEGEIGTSSATTTSDIAPVDGSAVVVVGAEESIGTTKTLIDHAVEVLVDSNGIILTEGSPMEATDVTTAEIAAPEISVGASEPAAVDTSTILVPSVIVPGPETETASEVITGGVIAPKGASISEIGTPSDIAPVDGSVVVVVGAEESIGTTKTLVDPAVDSNGIILTEGSPMEATDVTTAGIAAPEVSVGASEPAAVDTSTILVPSVSVTGPETEIASEVITEGFTAPEGTTISEIGASAVDVITSDVAPVDGSTLLVAGTDESSGTTKTLIDPAVEVSVDLPLSNGVVLTDSSPVEPTDITTAEIAAPEISVAGSEPGTVDTSTILVPSVSVTVPETEITSEVITGVTAPESTSISEIGTSAVDVATSDVAPVDGSPVGVEESIGSTKTLIDPAVEVSVSLTSLTETVSTDGSPVEATDITTAKIAAPEISVAASEPGTVDTSTILVPSVSVTVPETEIASQVITGATAPESISISEIGTSAVDVATSDVAPVDGSPVGVEESIGSTKTLIDPAVEVSVSLTSLTETVSTDGSPVEATDITTAEIAAPEISVAANEPGTVDTSTILVPSVSVTVPETENASEVITGVTAPESISISEIGASAVDIATSDVVPVDGSPVSVEKPIGSTKTLIDPAVEVSVDLSPLTETLSTEGSPVEATAEIAASEVSVIVSEPSVVDTSVIRIPSDSVSLPETEITSEVITGGITAPEGPSINEIGTVAVDVSTADVAPVDGSPASVDGSIGTIKTLIDPTVEVSVDLSSSTGTVLSEGSAVEATDGTVAEITAPEVSAIASESGTVDISTILVPSVSVTVPETEIASEVVTGKVAAPEGTAIGEIVPLAVDETTSDVIVDGSTVAVAGVEQSIGTAKTLIDPTLDISVDLPSLSGTVLTVDATDVTTAEITAPEASVGAVDTSTILVPSVSVPGPQSEIGSEVVTGEVTAPEGSSTSEIGTTALDVRTTSDAGPVDGSSVIIADAEEATGTTKTLINPAVEISVDSLSSTGTVLTEGVTVEATDVTTAEIAAPEVSVIGDSGTVDTSTILVPSVSVPGTDAGITSEVVTGGATVSDGTTISKSGTSAVDVIGTSSAGVVETTGVEAKTLIDPTVEISVDVPSLKAIISADGSAIEATDITAAELATPEVSVGIEKSGTVDTSTILVPSIVVPGLNVEIGSEVGTAGAGAADGSSISESGSAVIDGIASESSTTFDAVATDGSTQTSSISKTLIEPTVESKGQPKSVDEGLSRPAAVDPATFKYDLKAWLQAQMKAAARAAGTTKYYGGHGSYEYPYYNQGSQFGDNSPYPQYGPVTNYPQFGQNGYQYGTSLESTEGAGTSGFWQGFVHSFENHFGGSGTSHGTGPFGFVSSLEDHHQGGIDSLESPLQSSRSIENQSTGADISVEGAQGGDNVSAQNGVSAENHSTGTDAQTSIEGQQSVDGVSGEKGQSSLEGQQSVDGVSGEKGQSSVEGQQSVDGVSSEKGQSSLEGQQSVDGVSSEKGQSTQSSVEGQQSVDGVSSEKGQSAQSSVEGQQSVNGVSSEKGQSVEVLGQSVEVAQSSIEGQQATDGASKEKTNSIEVSSKEVNSLESNIGGQVASQEGQSATQSKEVNAQGTSIELAQSAEDKVSATGSSTETDTRQSGEKDVSSQAGDGVSKETQTGTSATGTSAELQGGVSVESTNTAPAQASSVESVITNGDDKVIIVLSQAESTSKPVESVSKPVESGTKPVESVTKPEESSSKPESSSSTPASSSSKPSKPKKPKKPKPSKPSSSSSKPESSSSKPDAAEASSSKPETVSVTVETSASKPETVSEAAEASSSKPETVSVTVEASASKPETVSEAAEASASKPETVTVTVDASASKPETVSVNVEASASKPETVSEAAEASASKPETVTVTVEASASKPEIASEAGSLQATATETSAAGTVEIKIETVRPSGDETTVQPDVAQEAEKGQAKLRTILEPDGSPAAAITETEIKIELEQAQGTAVELPSTILEAEGSPAAQTEIKVEQEQALGAVAEIPSTGDNAEVATVVAVESDKPQESIQTPVPVAEPSKPSTPDQVDESVKPSQTVQPSQSVSATDSQTDRESNESKEADNKNDSKEDKNDNADKNDSKEDKNDNADKNDSNEDKNDGADKNDSKVDSNEEKNDDADKNDSNQDNNDNADKNDSNQDNNDNADKNDSNEDKNNDADKNDSNQDNNDDADKKDDSNEDKNDNADKKDDSNEDKNDNADKKDDSNEDKNDNADKKDDSNEDKNDNADKNDNNSKEDDVKDQNDDDKKNDSDEELDSDAAKKFVKNREKLVKFARKIFKKMRIGPEEKFECTETGYFPDPNNCRKYYICYRKHGHSSKLKSDHLECPSDKLFDIASNVCSKTVKTAQCADQRFLSWTA